MKPAHFGLWVPISLSIIGIAAIAALLFATSAWSWPHAALIGMVVLFCIFLFAARIESWHQRRARQRAADAWAGPERRIRFASQDFKRRATHG